MHESAAFNGSCWLAAVDLHSANNKRYPYHQDVFPHAAHILCQWHLNKNIVPRLNTAKLGGHHDEVMRLIKELYYEVRTIRCFVIVIDMA